MIQKGKWEDEAEATRAASCSNASLQRVKEARWQQQTGAEGRSVKPRRRETTSRQTREQDTKTKSDKGEKIFSETMNIMAKQREGPSGQHLADFATLPHAVSKGVRA